MTIRSVMRGGLVATLALAAALVLPAGCGGEDADARPTITVFAAASTQDFVSAIARGYEERTGVRVRLNAAASSVLSRQIESGAHFDVFIAAHPDWMDRVEQKGLIDGATRRDVLGNAIVLAIPAEGFLGLTAKFKMGQQFDFDDAWTGRIAVADPEHVPAGVYAKQAMTSLGWWDDIVDQIVPAADARSAARLVTMREVQAGLLYASDVARFDQLAPAAIFPPESHEPIRYPAALGANGGTDAQAFLDALATEEAVAIARDHGFIAPAP